jgi:hypothetical protein
MPDIMPDVMADILPDITYSLSQQSVVSIMTYLLRPELYAWRPLAILPILKGSVCTVTDEGWLRHRRLELFHRSMDHIIRDINDLCSRDMYIHFADDNVRCSRAFHHLLVMDGAEVAAALLCDVNQYPVCTCPHSELDRTDVSYPYSNTESVKREVDTARLAAIRVPG